MNTFMNKSFYIIIFFIFLINTEKNIYAKDMTGDNQENDTVFINIQPRTPFFIYKKNDSKPSDGVAYHLLKKILNSANVKYEFNNIPLVRTLVLMKENKTKVCYPNALMIKSRLSYVFYSKPYFKDKRTSILLRKDDNRFTEYKTFSEILKNKNLRILLKIGYAYGNYIEETLNKTKKYITGSVKSDKPDEIILSSNDNYEMLNEIIEKNGDYMLISRYEAEYLFKENPKYKNTLTIKDVDDLNYNEKRYLMCSKIVGQETINKINHQIKKIANFD